MVGGDAVLLAAEHFNLLRWTATVLLRRVSSRDGSAIAGGLGERQMVDADRRGPEFLSGLRAVTSATAARRGFGSDCQPGLPATSDGQGALLTICDRF